MREESDQLCKEYGLSVISESKAKGKNYAEWKAEKESNRDELYPILSQNDNGG